MQGIVPTRVRGRYDETIGVGITENRQLRAVYRPQAVASVATLALLAVSALP